jgi:citrate synthase
VTAPPPYQLWDRGRGKIRSRAGGWRIGGGVSLYGHSLFDELMDGEHRWAQLVSLSVCGRMPSLDEAALIEVIWMCGAFPDPRIWCNQVSALAGTMRCTPVAGALLGTLASEALRYGPLASYHASRTLLALSERVAEGARLADLIEAMPRDDRGVPQLPGFVRPIAHGDARVPAMTRAMEALGIAPGDHLRRALEIDRILGERHGAPGATNDGEHLGKHLNAGGFFSAVLLDLGYSPDESQQLQAVMMLVGASACYRDALNRPAESFLPLRCSDVRYTGPPSRPVPGGLAREPAS